MLWNLVHDWYTWSGVCHGIARRPSIAEMDCNPVMVLPHGAVIVDARVRVQESPATKPLASRATVG